jgi:ribosomal protein S18 acetylase RimI-like enzyme
VLVSETVACRPVDPMSDAVAELARLFELYRIHYGQSPAATATRAWVDETARSGELEFYGAYDGPRMVGFAAVHQVPASLRLGRFWQLRDLFVDPAVRRHGIARRLVETVQQAAGDAGALRVSLQTEPDNVAALALYGQRGFKINASLTTLSFDIARQPLAPVWSSGADPS